MGEVEKPLQAMPANLQKNATIAGGSPETAAPQSLTAPKQTAERIRAHNATAPMRSNTIPEERQRNGDSTRKRSQRRRNEPSETDGGPAEEPPSRHQSDQVMPSKDGASSSLSGFVLAASSSSSRSSSSENTGEDQQQAESVSSVHDLHVNMDTKQGPCAAGHSSDAKVDTNADTDEQAEIESDDVSIVDDEHMEMETNQEAGTVTHSSATTASSNGSRERVSALVQTPTRMLTPAPTQRLFPAPDTVVDAEADGCMTTEATTDQEDDDAEPDSVEVDDVASAPVWSNRYLPRRLQIEALGSDDSDSSDEDASTRLLRELELLNDVVSSRSMAPPALDSRSGGRFELCEFIGETIDLSVGESRDASTEGSLVLPGPVTLLDEEDDLD